MCQQICLLPCASEPHTEVLCTNLGHLAIDFPQTITGIDDLGSVGDNLVSGKEILDKVLAKAAGG